MSLKKGKKGNSVPYCTFWDIDNRFSRCYVKIEKIVKS